MLEEIAKRMYMKSNYYEVFKDAWEDLGYSQKQTWLILAREAMNVLKEYGYDFSQFQT